MFKLLNLEAKIRGEIEENIDVPSDSSLCTRINHLDVFRYFLWADQTNTFKIFHSGPGGLMGVYSPLFARGGGKIRDFLEEIYKP